MLSEKSPGSARQGSLDGDLFLVRGEMRVVGVGHFLHQLILRNRNLHTKQLTILSAILITSHQLQEIPGIIYVIYLVNSLMSGGEAINSTQER